MKCVGSRLVTFYSAITARFKAHVRKGSQRCKNKMKYRSRGCGTIVCLRSHGDVILEDLLERLMET